MYFFLPEMTTSTCDTIYTHFQGLTNNIYGFGRLCLVFSSFIFLPIHPHFYPSTMVFTHPNDGWTGLCIKLWPPFSECPSPPPHTLLSLYIACIASFTPLHSTPSLPLSCHHSTPSQPPPLLQTLHLLLHLCYVL